MFSFPVTTLYFLYLVILFYLGLSHMILNMQFLVLYALQFHMFNSPWEVCVCLSVYQTDYIKIFKINKFSYKTNKIPPPYS